MDIDFFVGLFCPKMPQISQKDSKHLGDPVFTQVVFLGTLRNLGLATSVSGMTLLTPAGSPNYGATAVRF